MDKLMSIPWAISLVVALMLALATCLCMLRLCPIHFVPYLRRLWLTLFTYFGFIWNNNRFTPFRDDFLTAKGILVAQICLNDVLYTLSTYWYGLMWTWELTAMM